MKTVSINVMNLCVPCENHCRYCLLSYDGRVTGADYKRSEVFAQKFYDWLRRNRPELSFLFGFGYSMEHPALLDAIRFCQSIGSATGEFLQLDGMRMRSDNELLALLRSLKQAGVQLLNLTFYGTEAYHDRFAARKGDFDLMLRTLKQANLAGLDVSVDIPLTHENVHQTEDLITQLSSFTISRISCFVPHCEGRGALLELVRFTVQDYEALGAQVKPLFNRSRFRTEGEWLQDIPAEPERRVLTLTLTNENIDRYERLGFDKIIAELEAMDDAYYRTVPSFTQLLHTYADRSNQKLYSARDLYLRYQRRYIAEHALTLYDVNDERQNFSRRI